MREILFRGKETQSDEWVYGFYVHKAENKHQIVTKTDVFPKQVYAETVGQSTGLTDKNGVKIFEGDIIAVGINIKYPIEKPMVAYDMMQNEVMRHVKTGEYDIIGRSLYHVKWIDTGCMFLGALIKHEPSSIGQELGFGDFSLYSVYGRNKLNTEVIGNIYENCELLNKI